MNKNLLIDICIAAWLIALSAVFIVLVAAPKIVGKI